MSQSNCAIFGGRFETVHVVLVEPQENLNIGAVARCMSNFGATRLHLVAPRGYEPERAATTACWGKELLASAQIHATLGDAVANLELVVGFSARCGENRPALQSLWEWAERWKGAPLPQVALVFGSEDNGLRLEHLALCSYQINIPSSPRNPAFNLSHAVAIALAELARGAPRQPQRLERTLPRMAEFEQLDILVTSVLEQSDFYGEHTPGPVPGLVRSMFRRIAPDSREMGILLGLFGRLDRMMKRKH